MALRSSAGSSSSFWAGLSDAFASTFQSSYSARALQRTRSEEQEHPTTPPQHPQPLAEPSRQQESMATTNPEFGSTWLQQLTSRSSDDEEGATAVDIEANTSSTAASAERHRMTSASTIDLQVAVHWVEQSVPYMTLLLSLFVYQNCRELFLITWLVSAVKWSNETIRKQIYKKKDAKLTDLLGVLAILCVNIAGGVVITSDQQLWRQLLLLPPTRVSSAFQLILALAVIDPLARLACAAPKMLLVAAAQYMGTSAGAMRQQARILTLLEYCGMLYRSLIPVTGWYTFFVQTPVGQIFSSLLAGFYLSFKAASVWRSLRLMVMALQLVLRKGAAYGKYATSEEVAEAGNMCAICQDPMTVAIRLECSHVFCDDCINEWLERDRTCPMCRADVKPPGLQSFGDGSTQLLPQLF